MAGVVEDMGLKGSRTEQNLRAAFAAESEANRLYLYFAQKADLEGHGDVAALFRALAEGKTGHAHGHLEYLEACREADSRKGETPGNVQAALDAELRAAQSTYPMMAQAARDEGFAEIADWFDTLARAEAGYAQKLAKASETLGND